MCAFIIGPADWLRWRGVDVVKDVVSIFSHAWNQLTEGEKNHTFVTFTHIFCVSVLGDIQRRQFMVTWNGVWASSFHSHGSSFLWLCLSFFPVFHLYWAPTFFPYKKGKLLPLKMFPSSLLKMLRLKNNVSSVATSISSQWNTRRS